MTRRKPWHLCEDCGCVWECHDDRCWNPQITRCARCEEKREVWAYEWQQRQQQEENRANQ